MWNDHMDNGFVDPALLINSEVRSCGDERPTEVQVQKSSEANGTGTVWVSNAGVE